MCQRPIRTHPQVYPLHLPTNLGHRPIPSQIQTWSSWPCQVSNSPDSYLSTCAYFAPCCSVTAIAQCWQPSYSPWAFDIWTWRTANHLRFITTQKPPCFESSERLHAIRKACMRVLSASNHCCCEWCVKVSLCCVDMGCKCTSTRSARVYVSTGTTVSSWVTTNTTTTSPRNMGMVVYPLCLWRTAQIWRWRIYDIRVVHYLLLFRVLIFKF